MNRKTLPALLVAALILVSAIPIVHAQPAERGWNIAQAGFAEFRDISIDVDDAGPLPPGFLEVDVYHITKSNSGRNFEVAQYVVWTTGIPIAIFTLVDNQDAYLLLKSALGDLPVVDLSAAPDLLDVRVNDGKVSARIPSAVVPSPLPAGEILFDQMRQGEKQEIRTVFPLEATGYLVTQSYTIRPASASFRNGPATSEAWVTREAKTVISRLDDNLLPYMMGLITSIATVDGLAAASTDPQTARRLSDASEELFQAVTDAQLDKLRSSFENSRDAVATLERLSNIPEVLQVINDLYGGIYVTVAPLGSTLSGKAAETFTREINRAQQAFDDGQFSKAIKYLTEAYEVATRGR